MYSNKMIKYLFLTEVQLSHRIPRGLDPGSTFPTANTTDTQILYISQGRKARGVAQAVEHPSSKHKALSSNPSATQ
jgi:hypothetical protein